MPRFFTQNVIGQTHKITGEDAKHIIKSLRMNVGECLTLCDEFSTEFECEITSISEDVDVKILSKFENESEPSVKVTLYLAMPKGDKFEFVVQKSVELGVFEIVPVLTSRCISRPDSKSMQKKVERFNKIAQEAAKQSRRGIIPKVRELISFEKAIEQMRSFDCSILCYENGGKPIKEILKEDVKSVSLFVGSEGGFSQQEVEIAIENRVEIASLGKRILRCETAPLVALTSVMIRTNNI
jgi:16S rRNA (uracil1498-N3)-methyltransferase